MPLYLKNTSEEYKKTKKLYVDDGGSYKAVKKLYSKQDDGSYGLVYQEDYRKYLAEWFDCDNRVSVTTLPDVSGIISAGTTFKQTSACIINGTTLKDGDVISWAVSCEITAKNCRGSGTYIVSGSISEYADDYVTSLTGVSEPKSVSCGNNTTAGTETATIDISGSLTVSSGVDTGYFALIVECEDLNIDADGIAVEGDYSIIGEVVSAVVEINGNRVLDC